MNRKLATGLLLSLALMALNAHADTKISALPVAGPLTGSESVPLVQPGSCAATGGTCQTTPAAFVTYVNGAAIIPAAHVTGLAASATTDTTNAANISSGTLNQARILTCAANQVVFDNASGVLACSGNITWSDSTTFLTLGGTNTGAVTLSSGPGDQMTFAGGSATSGPGPSTTFQAGGGAPTGTTAGGAMISKGGQGGSGLTAGNGGTNSLIGGAGGTNGSGGGVFVTGGPSSTGATGSGGGVTVQGGSANGTVTANGASVSVLASNGGNSATTAASGGSIIETAGTAGTGVAAALGGSITLKAGNANSTANAGQIVLQNATGTNVLVVDAFGNVYCSCNTGASAADGFLYLGISVGAPTGVPAHTSGSYANSAPVRYDTTGHDLWVYSGAWRSAVQAPQTLSFQPGALTSITSTVGGFVKVTQSSTVDNIEASALTFTCATNPTITMYECGTSATCTSPATIGSVTLTASGQVFDGTVSAPSITAGDYVAWSITAGACTAVNVAATSQVHLN